MNKDIEKADGQESTATGWQKVNTTTNRCA